MDAHDIFNTFHDGYGGSTFISRTSIDIPDTPYNIGLCRENMGNFLHRGYVFHNTLELRTWDPELILVAPKCHVNRHANSSYISPYEGPRTFPVYKTGNVYGAYSEGGSYRGRFIYTKDQLISILYCLFQNKGGVSLSPGASPRQGFPAWEDIIKMMLHLELKYHQLKKRGPVYILLRSKDSFHYLPLSISNDPDEVVELGKRGGFPHLTFLL